MFGIQGYSALKAWVKVSETKQGGGRFGIIIKTGYGMYNSGSRNIVLKYRNYIRKVNSIKFFSDVKKTLFKLTKHSYLSFPPPCHISFFSVQFFNPYESAPVSKMRCTAKSSFNRFFYHSLPLIIFILKLLASTCQVTSSHFLCKQPFSVKKLLIYMPS